MKYKNQENATPGVSRFPGCFSVPNPLIKAIGQSLSSRDLLITFDDTVDGVTYPRDQPNTIYINADRFRNNFIYQDADGRYTIPTDLLETAFHEDVHLMFPIRDPGGAMWHWILNNFPIQDAIKEEIYKSKPR